MKEELTPFDHWIESITNESDWVRDIPDIVTFRQILEEFKKKGYKFLFKNTAANVGYLRLNRRTAMAGVYGKIAKYNGVYGTGYQIHFYRKIQDAPSNHGIAYITK